MMCALFVVSIIASFFAGIIAGAIGIILSERPPQTEEPPPILDDP